MWSALISDLPDLINSDSISSTDFSSLPVGKGRFAHALITLANNLADVNSSLRSSLLTICMTLFCTFSYVVNLASQPMHSLLLRVPSFESRESITFDSVLLQLGQYMRNPVKFVFYRLNGKIRNYHKLSWCR